MTAARPPFAGRLGTEQLFTRAELRASAGRYADALVDFDQLLVPQCRSPLATTSTARFTAAPFASAASGARTGPAPISRPTNSATPRGDMRPKSAAFLPPGRRGGAPPGAEVDRNFFAAADTQRSR